MDRRSGSCRSPFAERREVRRWTPRLSQLRASGRAVVHWLYSGPSHGEDRLPGRHRGSGRPGEGEGERQGWPMALVTCPVCRAVIDGSSWQCPVCQYRPGSWPDALLPTFALGLAEYTFQSIDGGVDYDYAVHETKGTTSYSLTFAAPGGSEVTILVFQGIGEPAPGNLDAVSAGRRGRDGTGEHPARLATSTSASRGHRGCNCRCQLRVRGQTIRAYARIAAGRPVPIEATLADRIGRTSISARTTTSLSLPKAGTTTTRPKPPRNSLRLASRRQAGLRS